MQLIAMTGVSTIKSTGGELHTTPLAWELHLTSGNVVSQGLGPWQPTRLGYPALSRAVMYSQVII